MICGWQIIKKKNSYEIAYWNSYNRIKCGLGKKHSWLWFGCYSGNATCNLIMPRENNTELILLISLT